MRLLIAATLLALLQACTTSPPAPPNRVESTPSGLAATGPEVAVELTTRYARQFPNCNNSASQPAFLCSGILLRGVASNATWHVWEPSPASVASGGVSTSYLRKDANFGSMAWGYSVGFIIFPIATTPGVKHLEVLCAFPVDAGSANRDNPGCGATVGTPTSRRCQSQGITTAEQWYSHSHGSHYGQCSFDVRDAMNQGAADSFYQAIRAQGMLGEYLWNEQIVATWTNDHPEQMPIEAFFYKAGGDRISAMNYQRDFYNITGRRVPVIRINFAPQKTGTATFDYLTADQAI